MKWKEYFSICYHPDPGVYIIHWVTTCQPINGDTWSYRKNAEAWIAANYENIIFEKFEEIVLA